MYRRDARILTTVTYTEKNLAEGDKGYRGNNAIVLTRI